MDPRVIVEDQDRPLIWIDGAPGHPRSLEAAYIRGFEAADASRGSSLLVLIVGLFLGAILTALLALVLVTHASAASRSAAEPVIPAAAPPQASRTVARRPTSTPPDTRVAAVSPSPSEAVSVESGSGGVASYCAPTPRYCQSWAPPALLGAVSSFRYGDRPYRVRVCRQDAPSRCTSVTVVSYCRCPAGRVIDLSVSAFRHIAPLSAGLVRVTVTRLGPTTTPPPTDTEEEPR